MKIEGCTEDNTQIVTLISYFEQTIIQYYEEANLQSVSNKKEFPRSADWLLGFVVLR